jgi:hypothetical protein
MYAHTYDVTIDAKAYARLRESMGTQRPSGLISHMAFSMGCKEDRYRILR